MFQKYRLMTSVATLVAGVGVVAVLAPDVTGIRSAGSTIPPTGLDPAKLQSALDDVHRAGVPGVYAEVRDADQVWRGASGVADVSTGRPVTPDMRQRVGSITKTFTAAAILQQVEEGRIELDAPIGH
jgi:D-alanyl-D-alanine carboxypeptidase